MVFDVGAHVGFVTLLAAHANPDGEVHAFEPLPSNFERLKRNVALNQTANVVCNAVAAGAEEGSFELYHDGSGVPSSTSLSYDFMKDLVKADLKSSTVSVIALDHYIQERGIPRVDIVKVDTESTEPQVLRGMRQTLVRDHPTIFCEVLPGRGTDRQLEEILGPLGYQFYHLKPSGPLHTERIEPDSECMNYLFTVRDSEELLGALSL